MSRLVDNCFCFRKSGHKFSDYPKLRGQEKRTSQTQASGPSSDTPKRNHFFSRHSRGEQGEYFYVVTGMLQVFSN